MDHYHLDGSPNVPKISDEKISEMLEKISPVVLHDNKLFKIKEVHPRNVAFTWDPQPTEEYPNLVEIGRIKTDHLCAYYGFIKPSIAEVLPQIPDESLDEICAFQTVTSSDKKDEQPGLYRSGEGHRLTTILYGLKK